MPNLLRAPGAVHQRRPDHTVTALCASLILLVSLVNCCRPGLWSRLQPAHNGFMRLWLALRLVIASPPIDWQMEGNTRLRKDGWYLIISNHMAGPISWCWVICSAIGCRCPSSS